MNSSKKTSENYQSKNQRRSEKLQNSSGLFMQLGLVLALFIVYVTFEYASPKLLVQQFEFEPDYIEIYEFPVPNAIVVEQKTVQNEPVQQKATPIDQINKVDDEQPTAEDIFKPTDDSDDPVVTIDDLINDEGSTNDGDLAAPILFYALEDAPVFPGCEGLKKEESKKCFTKAMTKFVNKNFRASTAEGLNLEGRQRITAMFTINKEGLVVDVVIKAPHMRLEKEARRVVEKLPQMIPGMQQKRPVSVKYTLPIIFDIQ